MKKISFNLLNYAASSFNLYGLDLSKIRPLTTLALQWPDFAAAKTLTGATNYYPQDAWEDPITGELFICVLPGGGTLGACILVYDQNLSAGTFTYKRCFFVGDTAGWGSIDYKNGVRRLGMRYDAQPQSVGLWNITTLPTNLSSVTPASYVATDAYVYGKAFNGIWAINTFSPVHPSDTRFSGARQLSQFGIFDKDLNKIGTVEFQEDISGSLTGNDTIRERYEYPHAQGFQNLPTGYFWAYGGNYRTSGVDGLPAPKNYHGWRITNSAGDTVQEHFMAPDDFIAALAAKGFDAERVEIEGCWYSARTKTMRVLVCTHATASTTDRGMLIFEVGVSGGNNLIDLTSIAKPMKRLRKSSPGVLDRINSKYCDELTLIEYSNMKEIMDAMFLRPRNLKHVELYSSYMKAGFTDINGRVLTNSPGAIHVTIDKMSGSTLYVKYVSNQSGVQHFLVQRSVDNTDPAVGVTSYTQTLVRIAVEANLQTNWSSTWPAGAGTSYMPLASEEYDDADNFDKTTYLFTAPVTGLYDIKFHAEFVSTDLAGQNVGFFLSINGATTGVQDIGAAESTGVFTRQFSKNIKLTAGQTVGIKTYSAAASGTKVIQSSTNRTWLNIALIS